MTLTAKTVSNIRNFYPSGDGPDATKVVGNTGKPQVFRGDGASSLDVSPGAGKITQYAVGEYDFTKDGAIVDGTIFGTGVYVPANAIVIRSGLYTDVLITGLTTGKNGATLYGAQVAATDSADGNLLATSTAIATAIGGSTVGAVLASDAGTWLHTGAAAREILIDISASASGTTTAGKVSVWCEYVIVENTLS